MLEHQARPSTIDVPASNFLDRSLLGRLAINWELVAYALLYMLTVGLRWAFLDNKPFHHDESQHAYFSYQFFRGNGYKYDPLLHGPFQFEFTALMYLLFGPNETAARLGDSLFGIGIVFLPFFLRRTMGRAGALILTALLAVSPTFVYFGRWEREDAFVTFFTFLIVVLFFNFIERPRTSTLIWLGAAWAFAFSVKESTFITAFIFGLFVLMLLAYEWFRLPPDERQMMQAFRSTGLDGFLFALAAFALVFTVLFTTFFSNPHGLIDGMFKSITYWIQQHDVKRGGQPWFYYVELLPAYEPLAVIFGLAGMALTFVKLRNRFTLFVCWYFPLSLLIYSWAGEKMPWLLMQVLLPLLILAAIALSRLWLAPRTLLRGLGLGLAGVLGLYMIHAMSMLTFQNPANPVEMLVYVQTSWDVETAVGEIKDLQRRYANTGAGDLRVDIDSNDGSDWPWAWYFRDAKGVQFPNMSQATYVPQAPVVVVTAGSNDRVAPLLVGYVSRHYKMREWWIPEPRVPADFGKWWKWLLWREPWSPMGSWDVNLYVRQDVWNANTPIGAIGGPVGAAPAALQQPGVQLPPVTALAPERVIGKHGGSLQEINQPRQIAVDAASNVYIADVLGHKVLKYAPDGTFVASYGGAKGPADGQLDQPNGIAVDASGNVFIADTWNHRVVELNPQFQFVRTWGTFGDLKGKLGEPGQFYGPRSLAVDPAGNVYVSDTGNKRIVKFTNDGKFVAQWGGAGAGEGQFQEPIGIALDQAGNIIVADTWNRRVQKLSPEGKFVAQWPVPMGSPQIHTEPYVTVIGDMVYATDFAGNRVIGIDTASGQTTQVITLSTAPQLGFPSGLASGSNGSLYIGDSNNGRVVVVMPPPAK